MSLHQPDKIMETVRTLSPFERVVFGLFLGVFVVSTFFTVRTLSNAMMVDVPASGGELYEGVVGSPRFINPLLATSAADKDLTTLLFAGLMKPRPNGSLAPDLAERFTISEDGLSYHFVLKENITFHDGSPVTADDVVFTITRAQDTALKSGKFANWEGVSVRKINEREVEFTLPEAYAPFLENTTLGILPKHLWENVSTEEFPFSHFNIEPVGAGPYTMENIIRNDVGIPERYDLERFDRYALGKPHIKRVHIRFYRNEDELIRAFERGDVVSIAGVSPEKLHAMELDSYTTLTTVLPRIFGVFFNKNRNELFAESAVREALSLSLNRERIVQEVLYGYGASINSPLPVGSIPVEDATEVLYNVDNAASILEKAGWSKQDGTWVMESEDEGSRPLAFTLATANTPELKHAAEIIVEEWNSFGIPVELAVYEPSDLTNNVIRPRRYDALFFGEVVGRELDLFAFWHSSQRNDPGLNIAQYTNIQADVLLRRARSESDRDKQLQTYLEFQDEIENDSPAVFTHSPYFVYIIPPELKNVDITTAVASNERFLHIHEWFIETSRVWSVFQ